jgi:hypothetical protein
MAFPNNPNPGDTYTDEYGTVWVYAGPINGWYRQTVIPVNDTTYIGSDGAPGGVGNNTEVVFNDNGSLASDGGLTYNKTTDALSGGAFVPTGSTVPSNGVYLPSANNVAISTNGTGRLFVDASGNLGVGTSTPSAKLNVSESTGASLFRLIGLDNYNLDIANNFDSGTRYDFNIGSFSGAFSFTTSAGERLRITSDGKLGLGTSSPSNDFDLVKTASGSTATARIGATAASGANNATLILNNGGTGNSTLRFDYEGSTNQASIGVLASDQKLTFGTAGSTAMTIDASQRVGIGTTSVSAKLQVNGSWVSDYGTLNIAGSDNDLIGVGFRNSSTYLGGVFFRDGTAGDFLELSAQGSRAIRALTNGSERLRIDSSGRLLVGTSSSSSSGTIESNLQVEGTDASASLAIKRHTASNAPPYLVLAKSRGGAGNVDIVQNGDRLGEIFFAGADEVDLNSQGASIKAEVDGTPGANDMPGRLVFSTTADGASSPTERMRINRNGTSTWFAGAGDSVFFDNAATAGTSYRFIGGRYGATGSGSGTISFQVFTNGNVQNANNSYGAISDITLKENIVAASSQWSDIKGVEVVNYNFKEETGHQTHKQLGVIAQQVEAVSPGLIDTDPDGLKSVNYSVLYMKAVKALQEAMERIEVLEAKVNALEGN